MTGSPISTSSLADGRALVSLPRASPGADPETNLFYFVKGHANIDILCCLADTGCGMATTQRNISLPPAADAYLTRCARRYGNRSAVVQSALRALEREEMGEVWREWQEAKSKLPQEPITPEAEQEVVRAVRKLRASEKRQHR